MNIAGIELTVNAFRGGKGGHSLLKPTWGNQPMNVKPFNKHIQTEPPH